MVKMMTMIEIRYKKYTYTYLYEYTDVNVKREIYRNTANNLKITAPWPFTVENVVSG